MTTSEREREKEKEGKKEDENVIGKYNSVRLDKQICQTLVYLCVFSANLHFHR